MPRSTIFFPHDFLVKITVIEENKTIITYSCVRYINMNKDLFTLQKDK